MHWFKFFLITKAIYVYFTENCVRLNFDIFFAERILYFVVQPGHILGYSNENYYWIGFDVFLKDLFHHSQAVQQKYSIVSKPYLKDCDFSGSLLFSVEVKFGIGYELGVFGNEKSIPKFGFFSTSETEYP